MVGWLGYRWVMRGWIEVQVVVMTNHEYALNIGMDCSLLVGWELHKRVPTQREVQKLAISSKRTFTTRLDKA